MVWVFNSSSSTKLIILSYESNDEKIIQIKFPKDILNYGKKEVIVDGEKVKMYNKERLLVELIRKKIISNYRKISENLNMYKIEEYLSLYKNEVNISDALLREVF